MEALDIEIDHTPGRGWFRAGGEVEVRVREPVPDQETVTCVIPGHHRQGRELFSDSIDVNAGRWCSRSRDDAPTRQHSSTHPTIDNETRTPTPALPG